MIEYDNVTERVPEWLMKESPRKMNIWVLDSGEWLKVASFDALGEFVWCHTDLHDENNFDAYYQNIWWPHIQKFKIVGMNDI